jgi:uncharacterized membrane protein
VETVMRMAMKTATYCAMHFVVAITVAYALSGSWKAALAIGLIEPFVQTFAFTVHERLWARAQASRREGSFAQGAV